MDKKERMALVTECRASGKKAKEWCEEKGIDYRKYVAWTTEKNHEDEHLTQQWANVTIKSEEKTDEIKLKCGKWTISVGFGFSPALLADILKVVDGLC